MIQFVVAYTLICGGILILTTIFADVDFSGYRHHRIREVSQYLTSQENKVAAASVRDEKTTRTIIDDVDNWLRWLDYPFHLNGKVFMLCELAYVVIVGTCGGVGLLSTSLYRSIHSSSFMGMILLWLMVAFAAVIVFVLPLVILRSLAGRRIQKMRRQFSYLLNYFQMFLRMGVQPDAIVLQTLRMIENPLRARLIQLYGEIQVLGPREAFSRFADRLSEKNGDVAINREYRVFKDAIINSLDYGTNAAEACGNLSRDLRRRKKDEAIKSIKRKPFLIILPKILFAVAILIIVTVPVLEKLFEFMNNG